MRHSNLIPWFHNQLQGSWNIWVNNCGIIPPPCWWTSTWCHTTCPPPPRIASFKRVITWQPAKVQRNVNRLTMISASTRLLQLERNHPDIGGEWSNAWALLKHHHSPGQRHQYRHIQPPFLPIYLHAPHLSPPVLSFRTPLSLAEGRSWTYLSLPVHLHVIYICSSMLPFGCRFCFIQQNAKLSDSIKGRCIAVRGLCFYVAWLKSGIISTGNGTTGVQGERDLKVKWGLMRTYKWEPVQLMWFQSFCGLQWGQWLRQKSQTAFNCPLPILCWYTSVYACCPPQSSWFISRHRNTPVKLLFSDPNEIKRMYSA